jgi:arylsulfatase A-like enzyme
MSDRDLSLTFPKVLVIAVVLAILIGLTFRTRSPVSQGGSVSLTDQVKKDKVKRQRDRSKLQEKPTVFPDSKKLQSLLKDVDWRVSGEAVSAAPDVVIIVLDTVRQDRLGVYGYPHNTSPNLDKWSEKAIVYDNARSVSSWTLPSHASLFTGQYPMTHGVHTAKPGSNVYFYALPDGRPTLAGRLREAGYATAGLAANRAFLNRRWGLHQGFDLWVCDELATANGIAYVTADRITDLAFEILEEPRERPIFLFLNYMDAHAPIIPRSNYVREGVKITREQMPSSKQGIKYGRALMQGTASLPEAVKEAWSEGYDSELRFLDEHLGRLLEGLAAHGVDDEDYVVILSDHGEYLGEHNILGHNKDIYEEGIAIPLLVRGPEIGAGHDSKLIQTVDVPKLILEQLGLPLLPNMESTGDFQVAELYWSLPKNLTNKAMKERFNRVRRAYIDDDRKLIVGSDESEERYDLGRDPSELQDLQPDIWGGSLLELRQEWLSSREAGVGSEVETSTDEEAALRALGYLE